MRLFFLLVDRSIEELRTAHRAARAGRSQEAALALARFLAARDEGRQLSNQIGFRC